MNSSRIRLLQHPFAIEPMTSARLAVLFPVGKRVRGRLLAKLDEEKYLLRLKGHNLVAKSSLDLEEGAPVNAVVLSTWPRLQLQLRDPQEEEGTPRNPSEAVEADTLIDPALWRFGAVRVDIRI